MVGVRMVGVRMVRRMRIRMTVIVVPMRHDLEQVRDSQSQDDDWP